LCVLWCDHLRSTRKLLGCSDERDRHSLYQLGRMGSKLDKPRAYTHYSFFQCYSNKSLNSDCETGSCVMCQQVISVLDGFNFRNFLIDCAGVFATRSVVQGSDIWEIQFLFSGHLAFSFSSFSFVHQWTCSVFDGKFQHMVPKVLKFQLS
jgi:hypothetical protein